MPAQKVTVQRKDEVNNVKEVTTPAPFIELDVNAVDIDISQSKSSVVKANEDKQKTEDVNKKNTKENPNSGEKISSVEDKLVQMEIASNSNADPDETEDFQLILEDTVVETEKPNIKATPPKTEKPPTIMSSARTPRRVQLITISSPKRTKAD